MKRLICAVRGHDVIPVREDKVLPRPGGILPMLDGIVRYVPDSAGDRLACVRCMQVVA